MRGSYSVSFFLCTTLLFFSNSSFVYTCSSLTGDLCRPDQRDALLQFKSEFALGRPPKFIDENDDCRYSWAQVTGYPKTKSWRNNSDCCYWDGVTCDVNSGVVIGIDLSSSCLQGHFKPNSSLFSLRHLRNLNLAYNDFSSSPIPSGFQNLMGLERLNLSRSSFSGQIPLEILHLTKLVSLDLSSCYMLSLFTETPFLRLLAQNLTNLRELDLSQVSISSKFPQVMANLTSLKKIHLRQCLLFGRLPSDVLLSPTLQSIDLGNNFDLEGSLPEFSGNNSLTYLDLSGTSLSDNIPNSISNLKHLSTLRFQNGNFTGKIPSSIGNLSQLTILHLSYNNFFGEIPSSFQNLKQMTNLDVSYNKLSGNFPSVLLNLTNLSALGISYNQFTGKLPPNFISLPNLKSFDANQNSFTGTLPSSLFALPSLDAVYLSDNQFNGTLEFGNLSSPSKLRFLYIGSNNFRGPIPRSISRLVNILGLDLSQFNTQGPVDYSIFSHLKSLRYLDLSHLNTTTTIDLNAVLSCFKSLRTLNLSGNHISAANVRLHSDLSSELSYLYLSGCGIREFPEFIKTLRRMTELDLSNNRVKDQVPGWLWSLPELRILDLSNNSFSGFDGFTRNSSRSQMYALHLSNNNFTGEIPKSMCGMGSLGFLDLSSNNFNGTVPYCFITLIQRNISFINLSDNKLSGKLPDIFLNGSNLMSLHAGYNQLTGKLPRSLSSCSSLEILNLEHNSFNDTFPFWLESLQDLQIMFLRSNEFHGSLEHRSRPASSFPQLQVIDISHNAFTGTLPSDFFTSWRAMSLERDRSELKYIGDNGEGVYRDPFSLALMNKGVELEYPSIPTIFTAIDLSRNRFQGPIPKSIGLLKNLKVLNLSSNAFNGNIPSSLANLTELESLDLSHNNLTGQIPPALGGLPSLSNITMSHNKLVGPIPQRSQFQTQSASSFEGNLGLCGLPLTQKCGDIDIETHQSQATESEEGVVSWTAAAIALAPGVIFGLTIGHILMITQKPRWLMRILGWR